jgi:hypothetical protein
MTEPAVTQTIMDDAHNDLDVALSRTTRTINRANAARNELCTEGLTAERDAVTEVEGLMTIAKGYLLLARAKAGRLTLPDVTIQSGAK